MTQQGGTTCANTFAGVVSPKANAIDIPNTTVTKTVTRPVRTGRFSLTVFSLRAKVIIMISNHPIRNVRPAACAAYEKEEALW